MSVVWTLLATAIVAAIGAFIYLTLSVNAEADRQDDVVSIVPIEDDALRFLRVFAAAVGRSVINDNSVVVYQNGDEIFPAILAVIANASSSIHIATFVHWVGSGVASIIAAATHRLWITSAYFVPSPPFVRALCEARARGVDVKILVPGPFHNKPMVRRASRTTWYQLISGGVEIYEHQRTMVHAKVLVAGGLISMVGSINFDPRSFALNDECAIVALDPTLVDSLSSAFERDLCSTRRVIAQDVEQLFLTTRMLDTVYYWLRAQL